MHKAESAAPEHLVLVQVSHCVAVLQLYPSGLINIPMRVKLPIDFWTAAEESEVETNTKLLILTCVTCVNVTICEQINHDLLLLVIKHEIDVIDKYNQWYVLLLHVEEFYCGHIKFIIIIICQILYIYS